MRICATINRILCASSVYYMRDTMNGLFLIRFFSLSLSPSLDIKYRFDPNRPRVFVGMSHTHTHKQIRSLW